MAEIVVTGAGMAGLITAMLLAKDGHDVTVLERDAAPPPATPEEAWDSWERRGVNQFRLLHFLLPRFRSIVEAELPEVGKALDAAGALRINVVEAAPVEMTGGVQEGDAVFEAVTGRRPIVEAGLVSVATGTPGVTFRRGDAVQGLITGTSAIPGVPHVVGVRTHAGDEIRADLVVDTTGRRSPLPAWLEAIGAARPIEELDDSGFVYYGRHFRSEDGSLPAIIGPFLQPYGSISCLTLPADNGSWGIGIITSSSDSALRELRRADAWDAVVGSLPLAAHWRDGVPLEDAPVVMAKIEDRHRSFSIDGTPIATGVVAVGDSWACTNPSLGRGISIATMHAVALRDTLRDAGLDNPAGLASAWEAATAATVEPYYRSTLAFDRARLGEVDAEIEGRAYEGDVGWQMTQALFHAAGQDGACLRSLMRLQGVMSTADDEFADPGLVDKVLTLGADWQDVPPLGPSRAELLEQVGA